MSRTKFPEFFALLTAPFNAKEIRELDPNKEGTPQARRRPTLKYVTAPTVKTRLDEVCGPEGWKDRYVPLGPDIGVECRLTLRLPDGSRITKSGAGTGKDLKAAYSDALKRAAESYGIARYLRQCRLPDYSRRDAGHAPDPGTPPCPSHPEAARHPEQLAKWGDTAHREPAGERVEAPRTGRALFAWVKEQERKHEVGLLRYLNEWAKLQSFPGRMVDWSGEQVRLAYAEASRKLATVTGSAAEAYEEALEN